jgi:hypothetical protein
MVTARIQDWLDKCVEFGYQISYKYHLNIHDTYTLLNKSWSRLLITFMVENSFQFFVTKDNQASLDSNNCEINDNNSDNDADLSKLPTEKDAQKLHSVISFGRSFNLKEKEFDELRKILFFRGGKLKQQKLLLKLNLTFFVLFCFKRS